MNIALFDGSFKDSFLSFLHYKNKQKFYAKFTIMRFLQKDESEYRT
ncbi:hypothetical protein [Campylobacter sp.]|nr:hypothetical protein [Campylobacter sp.]MCI7447007.1 hypothetical protein [Campylobacter sp.]